MTPAEKLQKMAENEQVVHGILKDTADVIRKYNGGPDIKVRAESIPGEVDFLYTAGVDEGIITGYADGYTEGHLTASAEVSDSFWNAIQEGGKRTNYNYAFAYWGGIDFKPKYPIRPTAAAYLFMGAKITRIPDGVTFDFSNATQINYICSNCSIEEFPYDISTVSASDLSALFGWNSSIKIIGTIILKDDGSQKLSYMFDNCYALEIVRFRGKFGANVSFSACTKLDHDSIVSIVNALLETASGKTLTLSKTAVNNAFEGGSTGTEWLNLIATKSNWTISLV